MSEINREALVDLVREAMASGVAHFAHRVSKGEITTSSQGAMTEAFGHWPEEFLRLRPDLIDALTPPAAPAVGTTSVCRHCRGSIVYGYFAPRYEPDYDPNNDPTAWRHTGTGYAGCPGFGAFAVPHTATCGDDCEACR